MTSTESTSKQPGQGLPQSKGILVVRDGNPTRTFRLHAGCGKTLFKDCANVDRSTEHGADFATDFDRDTLPFEDDTFDSVYCSHVIEHLSNPLHFMGELARVCCHGAVAIFKTPYGSSDNAWEDPTHVRPYFLDSFGYFSQAAYGGADYGYRGDWSQVSRELQIVGGHNLEELKDRLEELLGYVQTQRNIVEELKVTLRNVKPIRVPGTFTEKCPISFAFHQPKAVVSGPGTAS